MAQSQLYIDNILLLLFDTPNSPFSCSMRLLFRALFKDFTLCMLNLWVYRRVCALRCSFGAMLFPGEGWLVGVEAGEGPGLCCGSLSGESTVREALSILLPHTQGASGTATAGMMLIFGALL